MKKWFDNYEIVLKPPQGKRSHVTVFGKGKYYKTKPRKGSLIIRLPNSHTKKKHIFIARNDNDWERLHELAIIIDCLVFDLTKKKWWEFWK